MFSSSSRPHQDLIAALDIGSTKVACMIARVEDDGARVLGIGHQVSKGVRSGAVVDLEAAELAILNAVHMAEKQAGETISEVVVGLSGGQPKSQIISVEVPIAGAEVTESDVRHVLEAGLEVDDLVGLDRNRELIHTIPIAYSIDGSAGIRDPRGMYGETLGVNMHVVTASGTAVRNLAACLDRCRLDVAMLVMAPIASGMGCLAEDERDLGVTLIDLGGGTTTVAVFFDGHAVFCDVLPVGGQHVTSDIARVLSTPIAQAERLKTLHGCAITSPADEREMIEVVPVSGDPHEDRHHPRAELVAVIQSRLEETLERVRQRLEKSGFDKVAGRRVVLTGGACQIQGMREAASTLLGKQVRLGRPRGDGPFLLHGLGETAGGPEFATCAGLIQTALLHQGDNYESGALNAGEARGWMGRLGLWFRENF